VGPDGCAIFVHSGEFQVESVQEHVLAVDGTPSNQVALAVQLRSALAIVYLHSDWITTMHELVVIGYLCRLPLFL